MRSELVRVPQPAIPSAGRAHATRAAHSGRGLGGGGRGRGGGGGGGGAPTASPLRSRVHEGRATRSPSFTSTPPRHRPSQPVRSVHAGADALIPTAGARAGGRAAARGGACGRDLEPRA